MRESCEQTAVLGANMPGSYSVVYMNQVLGLSPKSFSFLLSSIFFAFIDLAVTLLLI